MASLTKLNVARHQLGTALELFIRDRDPVAVHCLVSAGCEIIETIATLEGVQPFSSHVLATFPDFDMRALREKQRHYYNAFKHMTDRGGSNNLRDDSAILASFDDTVNDAMLFIGWTDYVNVTGKMPVAAQLFQAWWYALNEEKLAPGVNCEEIRSLFPNVNEASRAEQKRRLRRSIERYRNDKTLLQDPRTENTPLCFPSTIFERAQ